LSVAKIPAKKESGGDFLKQKSSNLITIKKADTTISVGFFVGARNGKKK
jgi:hypothetical protein